VFSFQKAPVRKGRMLVEVVEIKKIINNQNFFFSFEKKKKKKKKKISILSEIDKQ
jgi:hypothetical protein